MNRNCRTDLAGEAAARLERDELTLEGLSLRRETLYGAPLLSLEITSPHAAEKLGKGVGHYYTLELNGPLGRSEGSFGAHARAVAEMIRRCGLPESGEILVAALGNPDITPDALGPLCASSVLVTRHLKGGNDAALWRDFASVSLLRTGVLGTAGVESATQIQSLCAAVKPAQVLVVDALAGAEATKLCRSIQVCDSGISPGAGVCNDRQRIDRELLGVPVTAIGVPTVADAAALGGGERERGLFVTPRDIDSSVRACARLIAYGINLALHPKLSLEDVDALVG